MEIKTFIGRKLNYIDGIYRRQIEIDRYLKEFRNLKLTYEYYNKPKNPLDFFSKRYLRYPYYCFRHTKNLKEYTIFHISFQYLADLSYFLDRNRTIITCHDIFTFLEKNNLKNPFIVQKYSLLGLKRCKYIIAISEFTKNELLTKLKIPEEKIFVIKNGINRKMFSPLAKEELSISKPLFPNQKKILHVGTEEYRKNFITLLKAFSIIRKKYQSIKLIRIGKPSYTYLIKKLGLEKDIIYINNINNERLREIYNLCDFLIFPSLYEGFGFPGLEAAACGTPVICSDISIFREIYQDFPLYFPPKDYKSLAQIILENIDNDEIKLEMRKKGNKVAKLHSWEKSAIRYFKLINFILENISK